MCGIGALTTSSRVTTQRQRIVLWLRVIALASLAAGCAALSLRSRRGAQDAFATATTALGRAPSLSVQEPAALPARDEVERCLTRGSWVRGPSIRPPWLYSIPSEGWCEAQGRPWENWVWEPADVSNEGCTATMAALADVAATRERACEILAGNRVLFVGDSVQDALYTALMYRLEPKRSVASYAWLQSMGKRGAYVSVCEGRAEMAFARNDHLLTCEEAQAGGDDAECAADYAAMGGGNGNMMNFLAAAANATVLIVNRGAHDTHTAASPFRRVFAEFSHNPAEEITRQLARQVTRLAKQIKLRGPWGGLRRFFWRSTPTGHWGEHGANKTCDYRTPGPPEGGYPPEYHWEYFAPQELVKQRILREELGEAFEILDNAKYLYLRRDRHVGSNSPNGVNDCLHYCKPGPEDHSISVMLLKLTMPAPGAASAQ